MANKKEIDIIKWIGVIIVVCQLIFGAGMLYSQHMQLMPLIQKMSDKQEEIAVNTAVNSSKIASIEKDVDRLKNK